MDPNKSRSPPIGWARQNTEPLKFDSKPSISQSKPVAPRRRWGHPDRYLRCDSRPSTPVLCNPSDAAFSVVFSNFYKCRPEVAGYVGFGTPCRKIISGAPYRTDGGQNELERPSIELVVIAINSDRYSSSLSLNDEMTSSITSSLSATRPSSSSKTTKRNEANTKLLSSSTTRRHETPSAAYADHPTTTSATADIVNSVGIIIIFRYEFQ